MYRTELQTAPVSLTQPLTEAIVTARWLAEWPAFPDC